MKEKFRKISMFSLLMLTALGGWAAACEPIGMACMNNGYSRGAAEGQRLIKDCVLPVASGEKTLPNTNFTAEQLKQCQQELAKKMKDQPSQQPQQSPQQ